MKRVIAIIACLLLLQGGIMYGQSVTGSRQAGNAEVVTVAATPEIENLAGSWVKTLPCRESRQGCDNAAFRRDLTGRYQILFRHSG